MSDAGVPLRMMTRRLRDHYIEQYGKHTDPPCSCRDPDCNERQQAGRYLAEARVHPDLWKDGR